MRFWTSVPSGTRLESGSPAMIKALKLQHLQGMHPAPCVVGTAHCRTLELYSYATLTSAEAMARFGTDKPDLRYGLELVDIENIRDVIAFPKTQRAEDLMLNAPSVVEEHQLHGLHLTWLAKVPQDVKGQET